MKFLKIIFVIPIVMALTFVSAAPVYASETDDTQQAYHHVLDAEGLLSEKNSTKIEKAAESVYEKNGIDLFAFLTGGKLSDPDETGSSVYESYARSRAAVVMMVDSESAYLRVYGRAQSVFSDDEIEEIAEKSAKQEGDAAILLKFVKLTGASLTEKGVEPIPEKRLLPRLVDDAGLLSKSDRSELLAQLDEISERRKLDIVVVTNNSLDGKTVEQYADDFFDYQGYGYGENDDGILLLLSMNTREWAISTYGKAIDIFTDRGQQYMTDDFLPYISDAKYYKGFSRFAELCDKFIGEYDESGSAFDDGNLPREPFGVAGALGGSLLIGLIAGLVVALSLKSQLTSVKPQAMASAYTKQGGLKLTERTDLFLYHNITRVARPKDTSSSSGHSGGHSHGSSTHTSSSGRSHGGSHGHF